MYKYKREINNNFSELYSKFFFLKKQKKMSSTRWGGTPLCPRCQKAVYMAEQVKFSNLLF